MQIELLVIDPQNDFCDKKGSLFVVGADADMDRLALFIEKNKKKLDDIHITMDSHHYVDIAHPIMWVDSHGNHPGPYTIILDEHVKKGMWRATYPTYQDRLEKYTASLYANKRYPLCIWPPHCLIGSWGASLYPAIFNANMEWEKLFNVVDIVTKGSNPWTEHYSAVQADVPDTQDPGTMLNLDSNGLIGTLQRADIILLAGEALSHCLANTVTDIADSFGEDNIKKMVLLRDATSPVPNPPGPGAPDFVKMGEDFIKNMVKRGMRVSSTKDFF
jgi:nicotinamidase-related amidase